MPICCDWLLTKVSPTMEDECPILSLSDAEIPEKFISRLNSKAGIRSKNNVFQIELNLIKFPLFTFRACKHYLIQQMQI